MKEYTWSQLNRQEDRPNPPAALVAFLTVLFVIWIASWFGLGMALQAHIEQGVESHEQTH